MRGDIKTIAKCYVSEFGRGTVDTEWAGTAYEAYSGHLDYDTFYDKLNAAVNPDPAAVSLGRKGGKVKSPTKAKTSAANGAKGGRPKGAFTEKSVDSVFLGYNKINGTDWPIENILYRCTTPSGRVSWKIVWSLCNGTANGSDTYKTKHEALSELHG